MKHIALKVMMSFAAILLIVLVLQFLPVTTESQPSAPCKQIVVRGVNLDVQVGSCTEDASQAISNGEFAVQADWDSTVVVDGKAIGYRRVILQPIGKANSEDLLVRFALNALGPQSNILQASIKLNNNSNLQIVAFGTDWAKRNSNDPLLWPVLFQLTNRQADKSRLIVIKEVKGVKVIRMAFFN